MSWRDDILADFDPTVAPLLLVADPDGLLRDAEIALELPRRGYTLLPYADPITFRLQYETMRDRPLVVVIWEQRITLTQMPYDLLRRGVLRSIGLATLFPRLHIPALATIAPADLDRLWLSYGQQRGPMLSAQETAAAVIQLCFGISLTALQTPADALTAILQIHTRDHPIPQGLTNLLCQQLARIPAIQTWPLDALMNDHATLDAFLSRAWPRFLADGGHLIAPPDDLRRMHDGTSDYQLAAALPLDDARIWPLIDTLFLAGRLTPLRIETGWHVAPPYDIGTRADQGHAVEWDGIALAQHLAAQIPPADAAASVWLSLAPLMGELLMLAHGPVPAPDVITTANHLRRAFAAWVPQRYGTMLTLAPLPTPRMVSHLAHWMAMERQRGARRQALLVLDGLAIDQWALLRTVWAAQGRAMRWDERAVFAWLPTLTSISRQAIFAGSPPASFAPYLDRTDHEESHWQRFWRDHGLHPGAVAYMKGLHGLDPARADAEIQQVAQFIDRPGIQIVGMVIDSIDKIAHGMHQGEAGMQQQVRQWAERGWMAHLVELLRDAGFQVILTADHGNVAARGVGRPNDGILADERGLRARIYRDSALRDRILPQFPQSLAWDGHGLPPDRAALLAADGQAFAPKDTLVVTHGGADLCELIVPWCILR